MTLSVPPVETFVPIVVAACAMLAAAKSANVENAIARPVCPSPERNVLMRVMSYKIYKLLNAATYAVLLILLHQADAKRVIHIKQKPPVRVVFCCSDRFSELEVLKR